MGHFQTRPQSGRISCMHESDPGVPPDSPPKLTCKKETNSQPKPLIFNIFLSQSAYFRLLIGSVKKEVITPPSSGSGAITFYLQVIINYLISSKSTAMLAAAGPVLCRLPEWWGLRAPIAVLLTSLCELRRLCAELWLPPSGADCGSAQHMAACTKIVLL